MRSKKQQEVNGLTWNKKAFSIVLFLIAAILTARIFMVNLQWPAASRIEIPTGEKFSLDGLALCVESSSIMSPEEIYAFCKIDEEQATRLMLEQMIAQGWQAKILCITLSAANETDHPSGTNSTRERHLCVRSWVQAPAAPLVSRIVRPGTRRSGAGRSAVRTRHTNGSVRPRAYNPIGSGSRQP